MDSDNPQYPLDYLHRVRVDGRKICFKERIALVRECFPRHYRKYGGSHYLSPEAYAEPIENLRQISPTFDIAKENQRTKITLLIEKLITEIQKL